MEKNRLEPVGPDHDKDIMDQLGATHDDDVLADVDVSDASREFAASLAKFIDPNKKPLKSNLEKFGR